MPRAIRWAACPVVDNCPTTLRISCPEEGTLEIVDKTPFGRNPTRVSTDGSEREQQTRNKKKVFMLSATTSLQEAVLQCRLVSRGSGWYTRQERELAAPDVMHERHVLVRPGESDISIQRVFKRANEELRGNLPPPGPAGGVAPMAAAGNTYK